MIGSPHARAGDLLALVRRPVEVDPGEEYREVGVRSFGNGIFHKEPTRGIDLGSKRVFRIEPGDLVISNVFAWEGAIAIAGQTESGMIGSHRFMTFVPKDDRLDASWAAWFLLSEPGLELIGQASPGSAGRNRTLGIERFGSLEILLPPISEQRAVATTLDHLRTEVATLERLAGEASRLSSALVVSATSRPDFDETARERAGWRRTSLSEVMKSSNRQKAVDPLGSYSVAGIYSFGRGLIDRGSIRGAETSYKTLTELREGDIVVSKLNGWEGAIAVVPKRFDGYWVSSEYPTFTPDPAVLLPGYFAGIAKSPWFWEALDSSARGSMVRRRRINRREFLNARVWLPPVEVQRRVTAQLGSIERTSELRQAAAMRVEALLPAALNTAFATLT